MLKALEMPLRIVNNAGKERSLSSWTVTIARTSPQKTDEKSKCVCEIADPYALRIDYTNHAAAWPRVGHFHVCEWRVRSKHRREVFARRNNDIVRPVALREIWSNIGEEELNLGLIAAYFVVANDLWVGEKHSYGWIDAHVWVYIACIRPFLVQVHVQFRELG